MLSNGGDLLDLVHPFQRIIGLAHASDTAGNHWERFFIQLGDLFLPE